MNKTIYRIGLVFFLLCFLVSGFFLVRSILDYKRDTDYYQSLQEKYHTFGEGDVREIREMDFSSSEKEDTDMTFLHTNFSYILIQNYSVDFTALKEMNPDIIGWIKISDTEINYPVLLSHDNVEYVRTGPDGNVHNAGSIFVDFRNQGDFNDQNTIIYGHNQRNHKMFHDLYKYYSDSEFAESHKTFTILTPDKRYTYRVFGCTKISAYDKLYKPRFSSDAEFSAFVDYVNTLSDYDFGEKMTTEDRMVILSTCTNEADSDRIVVLAKRIDIEE